MAKDTGVTKVYQKIFGDLDYAEYLYRRKRKIPKTQRKKPNLAGLNKRQSYHARSRRRFGGNQRRIKFLKMF